jgi:Tol biopolymer transport system component
MELMRMPPDGGPAAYMLTGNIMFQYALRAAVCVLYELQNDQRSFVQLDPIHGRGATLARTKIVGADPPMNYKWSLSPDGRNVAYLPKNNGNQIGILSMEGKTFRTITVEGERLQSPTWAADGEHLYVVSNQHARWKYSLG